MRPIFQLIAFAYLSLISSEILLFIGDSFDRYFVEETCKYYQNIGENATAYEWGTSLFHADHFGGVPTWCCISNVRKIQMFYVRILGSPPSGPYYHFYKYVPNGKIKYVDTQIKVTKSIQLFRNLYGLYPDRIIFNSAQWDVHRIYQFNKFDKPERYSQLWNDSVKHYEKNVNDRLDQIISLVPPYVDVGIRTTLTGAEGGELLGEFNAITRNIAETRKLTFYDMDLDIYSTVNFNYTEEAYTHRDWIHPDPAYSMPAAHKMLGIRYSKYMIFAKNTSKYEERFRNFLNYPRNEVEVLYLKSPKSTDIFYLDANNVRYKVKNAMTHFRKLRTSIPGDVMQISEAVLDKIKLSDSDITSSFEDGSILNIPFTNTSYLIVKGKKRKIPSYQTAQSMSHSGLHKVYTFDKSNYFQTDSIPMGRLLPDIFKDGCKTCREIYVVFKETRRSIPNMDTFVKLGKDLSEVVVIDNKEDYVLLPIGSSM